MKNAVTVKVQESLHYLLHVVPSFAFTQRRAVCFQVAVELAIVAHLLHQIHVRGILKVLVQLK